MNTPRKNTPVFEQLPGPVPLPGLLEVVAGAFFADFHAELEATPYADIRPTHGCVFRFLREEGMRPTRLAALAGMTKQSIGEITDDLLARGYVERIADPEDRRAKLIRLTEQGKRAQRTGHELFTRVEKRWSERYGAERIAGLRALLEEIAATDAPGLVPELAREPSAVR